MRLKRGVLPRVANQFPLYHLISTPCIELISVYRIFSGQYTERKTPVIMLDEAPLLSREMLEEIRFLLNLRMDSYSTLALILIGQTELKEALKLQVYQAIAQRVDIRFHLSPMEKAETETYVKRYLEAAKAPSGIFTQAALGVLHEYAGGIPRKVNKVAIACLMAAAG